MGMFYTQQPAKKRLDDKRSISMSFVHNQGWHCEFLDEDLKGSLRKKLTFAFSDKIIETFERWGSKSNIGLNILEHAISNGRGGIWLTLQKINIRN